MTLTQDVVRRAQERVGTTLCGKWQLDRVLGVGGMATVYAATHRNRNRVAIKLLHTELSIDESVRSRFLREGYVANTIGHPGAVKVLDDDVTEDGSAFLVMELLLGESVEQRAERKGGVLSLVESLVVADQLLDVLAAAHERHIVHRDIKPDNLFVTDSGRLKVLDFGIAGIRRGGAGSTRVGSFMGTPAFAAPEQARGRWSEVDGQTDVFAVGATLFSLLSGRQVHEAETASEQLALAINQPAPPLTEVLPDVDQRVAEIVDTALAYEKADRWANAHEMQRLVRRILDSLPGEPKLSEPPPGPLVPVDRNADTIKLPVEAARAVTNEHDPSRVAETTAPASPRALASVRRIALGVAVSGVVALAVAVASWFVSRSIHLQTQSDVPPPADESATEDSAQLAAAIPAVEPAPQASAAATASATRATPETTDSEPTAPRPQGKITTSATRREAIRSSTKPATSAHPMKSLPSATNLPPKPNPDATSDLPPASEDDSAAATAVGEDPFGRRY